MRLFVAVVLACPACFTKPLPPGECASWSAWSAPVELAGINTPDSERGPWLSPDRLELVFTRLQKTWISVRPTRDAAFPAATEIVLDPPVAADSGSFVSDDDGTLYYTALNPDEHDPFVATRNGRGQPFGGATQIMQLSSARNDLDPDLDRDQLAMVLARDISGTHDLFLATREGLDRPWTVGTLADLNTTFEELEPTLSGNGLDIVFATDRDGGSTRRLYQAHHADAASTEFSDVKPFEGTAGLSGSLADPQLSRDGTALVFARDVGSSNYDLFYIERTCGDR